MDTRKLQQVGGGTFTVSIPKAWATEHGLEAGADVHLYTHADGSVVVRSAERDGGRLEAVEIEIRGPTPAMVERTLLAAHAVGFETVTLRPEERFTDEQRRAARRAKRHLVGTELLVERDDEIAVRNLLDAADVSVRQSVVQLQFVALSIHREATAAFAAAEGDAHGRIVERVEEADRLAEMVARHCNRALVSMEEVDRLGTTRSELFDAQETARELARVAHLGASIARLGRELSAPLEDDTAAKFGRVADAARDVVDAATNAVLEGEGTAAAHAALDRRDEAVGGIRAVDGAPADAGPDAVALARALDALVRTAEGGGAIANVAIRAALRSAHL